MKALFRGALLFGGIALSPASCTAGPPVHPGAEVLLSSRLHLLEGKRVGLITNQTGRLPGGGRLVDSLLARGIILTALFSPEHGIRGTAPAGHSVGDTLDLPTGLPVFSLHGAVRKPTPAMLHSVDVFLYDLQDVGVRFYTYVSTMTLVMEAAAEEGIPFVVLDRPNPLGGHLMDGPVVEDSLRSFLGMVPVPVVYGLTCGELARMINGEGWLKDGVKADLTVIPMEGWTRRMQWSDTGLPWVPPSPNIPSPATTRIYPATCLLEATNISEGRGTARPFMTIGAPFVDGGLLAEKIRESEIPGLVVDTVSFVPSSSKHAGVRCGGVGLSVTAQASFLPVEAGMAIVQHLRHLFPDSVQINLKRLDALLGSVSSRDALLQGETPARISAGWQAGLDRFRALARPYLLYHD